MPWSIFIACFCSFSAKFINKFFLSHFSQNIHHTIPLPSQSEQLSQRKSCTLPNSQIAASGSPIGLIKNAINNKINPFCGEYVINTATLCQILLEHIRICFYKPLLPYLCQSIHIFKDGHSCHCRSKKDVRSYIIEYCNEKGD